MEKEQYQVMVHFTVFSHYDNCRTNQSQQRQVTASSETQAIRIAEKRVLQADYWSDPQIIRSEIL